MTDKTIRMPKKLLAKWLKALRSGEYKQTGGVMYEAALGGFCCLGVLQHVASNGSIEVDGDGNYRALPSQGWLDKSEVQFLSLSGAAVNSPYLPKLKLSADEANDDGATFKQIAKAIEAAAEGI